ncbi:TonB-dependent receptor [Sunxiuqinia sp. A32]|uniref:TonB-dependent receptor n=1 Tax=Sunxiuqinia sp. A32 TaxID=3461496 RepID=UPI0040464FDB
MRLTIGLIILTVCSTLASDLYSQTNKLSLEYRNENVVNLLRELENQSKYRFFYNEEVNLDFNVTISIADASINQILSKVFENHEITFEIIGRQIILTNKSNDQSVQSTNITGKVTDSSGAPLPGVTVVVKGTSNGTITDFDGNYSLSNISSDVTIVLSFVGMKSQEIEVGSKTIIDVVMVEDAIGLEEVVAIGYGTQKKSSLTSSVAEIDGEELVGKTNTDARQILQGVTSGVSIIDAGGAPGGNDIKIRIRGTTTIGNNEPLIFVNGIEQNFKDINPDNIESITVLKDASATSIYGSRGANGVILVTTKRPVAQALKVSYRGSYGFEMPTNLPEPLGLEKYMRLQNYAVQNANLAAGGDGNVLASMYGRLFTEEMIDRWVTQNQNPDSAMYYPTPGGYFEDMFQRGALQNHSFSITGGTEQLSSRLSVQLVDQDGIMLQSNFLRKDVSFDNIYTPTDWLKLSGAITYRRKDVEGSDNPGGVINGAYHGSPWVITQYSDGSFGMNSRNNNPNLVQLIGGDRTQLTDYLVSDIKAELKFNGDLSFTVQYGGYTENVKESIFKPKYAIYDEVLDQQGRRNTINSLRENAIRSQRYSWRNLINYNKDFGKHKIQALLGYEQQWYTRANLTLFRQDFYTNEMNVINAGSVENQSTGGGLDETKLRSVFGRVNYGFLDRYLFEMSLRYDGSSKFYGAKNQYGIFPAVSMAWNISNEPFWESIKSTVRGLKLRGSWGQTGANTVPSYSFFSGVNIGSNYSFGGTVAQTAAIDGLVDQNLTWETTTQWNIGMDSEFLEGKLNMTFEYWDKKTEDILLVLPIMSIVGFNGPFQNAGRVDNTGWDLSITHRNVINKDFSYSIRANLSDFKNEVVSLNGTGPYIGGANSANGDITNVIAEGESLNSFWGYIADGYYEESLNTDDDPFVDNVLTLVENTLPGSLRYKDINDDKQITAEDKTVIGNEDPHFSFGLNTDLKYKNFDLSLFFQGVGKQDRMPRGAIIEAGNWLGYTIDLVADYWTPDNTDAKFPRPQKSSRHNGVDESMSTHWVLDASYIRLKNVQVGYTLPKSVTSSYGIDNLRFYLSGTNLWWTSKAKEWGVDPEVQSGRLNFYPQTSQIVMGVMLEF